MTVFGAGAPSPHELGERAQAAINQGHVEEAIGWWRQAVEQAASANDTEGMGYALLNIAMASTQLGDFEAAEEAFLEAVGTGHPAIVPRASLVSRLCTRALAVFRTPVSATSGCSRSQGTRTSFRRRAKASRHSTALKGRSGRALSLLHAHDDVRR